MGRIALVTGVNGQGGAYLAELVISKGYIVHGLRRRSSIFNKQRINHLISEMVLSDLKNFKILKK